MSFLSRSFSLSSAPAFIAWSDNAVEVGLLGVASSSSDWRALLGPLLEHHQRREERAPHRPSRPDRALCWEARERPAPGAMHAPRTIRSTRLLLLMARATVQLTSGR